MRSGFRFFMGSVTMDESETEEEGCNGWSVTENVDPPDMKFGGLGDVFQLTRSQGQISNSPERSVLSLHYGYIVQLVTD